MGEASASAPVRLDDEEVRSRLVRLDALLEQVERAPGPATAQALEAVELLVQVYGEALGRVVAHEGGRPAALEWMVRDELLEHLLVLHGLHPDPVEQRVEQALEEVRPYLQSHGGEVTLQAIDDDGVVRVSLSGSCSGCASSAATLEHAVSDSVLAAAPELTAVEAMSASSSDPAHQGSGPALIPVEALLRRPATTGGRP